MDERMKKLTLRVKGYVSRRTILQCLASAPFAAFAATQITVSPSAPAPSLVPADEDDGATTCSLSQELNEDNWG